MPGHARGCRRWYAFIRLFAAFLRRFAWQRLFLRQMLILLAAAADTDDLSCHAMPMLLALPLRCYQAAFAGATHSSARLLCRPHAAAVRSLRRRLIFSPFTEMRMASPLMFRRSRYAMLLLRRLKMLSQQRHFRPLRP